MLPQANKITWDVLQEKSISGKKLNVIIQVKFKKRNKKMLDLLLHKPPWTLTTLIVSLNKVFNALFGFTDSTKSYAYKQTFSELKASIEDYNKIIMSNQNNYLELISCSLKMSENILTFIKNFENHSLDEKLSCLVTILEKNHFIGYNICQTLKYGDMLLTHFENEEESSCSENLKYIEVIWDKFRNLSLLTIDSFQNADSKKIIQTDVFFSIQYSITHESIGDLNQFYESCLNDCTKKNLRRFSKAIYVLYKILQLNKDSNIELQTNIELDECKQILSTVKRSIKKERMINVFWQFKEFENRFSMINHDDFLSILKYLNLKLIVNQFNWN
ncbi:hypothetical protein BpHYR1_039857 [Brachionus plicatilis]|uniref:Uncharacterized protein n=1 Tax=Brachionus plicatilis TaxID=10195 RepID=A0A3M7RKG4_BRAPC|nr:hypothetical protein BpHYR1_039857 [Brachionus plicatilis]